MVLPRAFSVFLRPLPSLSRLDPIQVSPAESQCAEHFIDQGIDAPRGDFRDIDVDDRSDSPEVLYGMFMFLKDDDQSRGQSAPGGSRRSKAILMPLEDWQGESSGDLVQSDA
jgi:hypothetical protein